MSPNRVPSGNNPQIVILGGGGGIGRAVAFLLRALWDRDVDIHLVDSSERLLAEAMAEVARAEDGGTLDSSKVSITEDDPRLAALLEASDLLLDCLPGRFAVRAAELAHRHGTHYANLTEHVAETAEISRLAADAPTAYALQCGLAPGFVDVLGMALLEELRAAGVETAEQLVLRVGALTRSARPPHFYGFTWSPAGVATEYLEPAVVVRDFAVTQLPSLSEREIFLIDGVAYEEALTSGGAADLPQALAGRVRDLDYKTLRYPGHYAWIDGLLGALPPGPDRADRLQRVMEDSVPYAEDDVVVVYAAARGRDGAGRRLIRERALRIPPFVHGGLTLRAIQATTAAGLAEAARVLLTGDHRGLLTQSVFPTADYFGGPFVSAVYGDLGLGAR